MSARRPHLPASRTRRDTLALPAAGAALSLGASLAPRRAGAQSGVGAGGFPAKPVKLVVGYPPGGSGDFVARTTADEMSRELGVSVVVENRPGAGGAIASELIGKSTPDGYTLLVGGPHAELAALYRKLNFHPFDDFVPITKLAVGPMIICVNNELPVRTLRELIAHARANPGALMSAASGNGSRPHIASAQFETVAGARFTTVQFKGGAAAAQSTIAGETHVMFATPPTVIGLLKAGRMRPLAVTTSAASPAIPGIPGAQEAGLPGYDSNFWFGLYAPAGTSAAIVARLHEAATRPLRRSAVRERLAVQGMDPAPSASPEAFAAALRDEAPELTKAVRDSGARLE